MIDEHSTQSPQTLRAEFLQDTRIITDIVNAVRPQPDDIVIEIGPGLAAITEPLTRHLRQLHVCEIDRDIICFWKGSRLPTSW